MEGKRPVLERKLFFQSLRIEDLSLNVHLGCKLEERNKFQEVRIAAELRFSETPKGAFTDSLDDTVCLGKLSEAIRSYCESREFQLIEKMGVEVYSLIREMTAPGVLVGISIHKVHPPIKSLLGGSFFRCGDFTL